MLDYAFIELLESLTRDEIRSLRKFIVSPYFNKSAKVVKLFDIIIKYHPNFESPKLAKEELHKKITPELPYNELTMRRLLYDLQQLVSKFIRQQYIERKDAESALFTIEELAVRGSERMHAITIREAEKIMGSAQMIDADACLNNFKLETEKFYFGMINDKITKKSFVDTEAGKLIKGITYFISYFMLEAIKHNDTLLNYSRSFNIQRNKKFISQFLNLFDFQRLEIFMKSHAMAGSEIVRAYINSLKAYLYFENDEFYTELKESVVNHLDQFSQTDKHFLFSKLSGYCILKRDQLPPDAMKYERELFELYKILLENKYYTTEASKFMPVDLYRNILIQSVKMKELRWLEDFIEDYGRELHPARKADILNFSYAYLNFARGNFNDSLSWLSRIRMEEFSYHLDIRSLYIMIYFELEEYESALAAVKAFKKYLNENTMVSEDKKTSYENLCKFVTKLVNYQGSNSKTDISSLAVQLKKCRNITSRSWLTEKVEHFERSIRKAV
ncbi:MAG TPA: hypothetical protein PK605_14935 [Ignavibacteria bacterium]|nr:hypothetical protein [Bacteroidota bacterium]HRF66704.1 hypothetical protein [Ignavibacteria bacterium]HRJ05696.1 hypothetical protein [Ignavibacteria bacterium]HRJ86538.1 hypothetical protein [Ignavibacteria bacterium]